MDGDPTLIAARNFTQGDHDFDELVRWLRRTRKINKREGLAVRISDGWLEIHLSNDNT